MGGPFMENDGLKLTFDLVQDEGKSILEWRLTHVYLIRVGKNPEEIHPVK
jgi:hypothetical protein